jgi:hypothetical protein
MTLAGVRAAVEQDPGAASWARCTQCVASRAAGFWLRVLGRSDSGKPMREER